MEPRCYAGCPAKLRDPSVRITVVLGRLGAPVLLTLHLSWRWRMKTEIGLVWQKHRSKTELKVAGLKNLIYIDHLSQLPTRRVVRGVLQGLSDEERVVRMASQMGTPRMSLEGRNTPVRRLRPLLRVTYSLVRPSYCLLQQLV